MSSQSMTVQHTTIPILGMTCTSYVQAIERALRGINGVQDVAVNLAGGKAQVIYDPKRTLVSDMLQVITDVGYEIGASEVTLQVTGMTCASCMAHVEGALIDLPGVTAATVSLGLGTARVPMFLA